MRNETRFDLSSFWAGIFIGLLVLIVFLGYLSLTGVTIVNCPQEDSCYADYFDGTWHIIEGERE